MLETTCTHCGAAVQEGVEFCPACGLEPAEPTTRVRSADEREAAREYVQAYKAIRLARLALLYLTISNLVLGAFHTLLVARAEHGFPVQWVLVAGLLGTGAFCGLAARRVVRSPLRWTLGAGILQTAVLGNMFVLTLGLPLLPALATVAIWLAFPAAIRAQRLLEEQPGLLDGRPARGSRRAALDRRSGANRLGIIVAGLVVIALGIPLFLLWKSEKEIRPSALEEVRARFEAAWNEARFNDIRKICGSGFKPAASEAFRDGLERREWTKTTPSIGRSLIDRYDRDNAVIFHEVESGRLSVSWHRDRDGHWRIRGIDLPRIIPGEPLDPTLDLFVTAWNEGDAVALGRFHHNPAFRTKAAANFAKLQGRYEKAGIDRRVRSARHNNDLDGGAMAILEIGKGSLDLEWRWHPSGWKLHKVQAPR